MKKIFLSVVISLLILLTPNYSFGKINKPSKTSSSFFDNLTLVGINILDRNGLSETITSKEKLTKFAKINFNNNQPYQKVMRIYKNKAGDNVACLTSYHANGQIKQYLECLNNRAFGRYREWYNNGKIKIIANIIGGAADLHPSAESSWLFDGETQAYSDNGKLEASILYQKGLLEGTSLYYHSNGEIWKECSYSKGVANGIFITYTPQKFILKTVSYLAGKKHGETLRYYNNSEKVLSTEWYENDKLWTGNYLDPKTGEPVACIKNGYGIQILYSKSCIAETKEICSGDICGKVTVLDPKGDHTIQTYSIINGKKEGEETFFFPNTGFPKLQLTWHEGLLQGTSKSWYSNGNLESCRELVNNKKSGLLTIYYPNGHIMATEEYDNDLLIKGDYFRSGETLPHSKIDKGCGYAIFFSQTGTITKKIFYQDGKPQIN